MIRAVIDFTLVRVIDYQRIREFHIIFLHRSVVAAHLLVHSRPRRSMQITKTRRLGSRNADDLYPILKRARFPRNGFTFSSPLRDDLLMFFDELRARLLPTRVLCR